MEAFSQRPDDHRLEGFPGMSVLVLGSLKMLMLGHGASVPGRFSLGKCSFGSPVLQQFITSGRIDRGRNFASQLQGWGEFRVFQSFRNFFGFTADWTQPKYYIWCPV